MKDTVQTIKINNREFKLPTSLICFLTIILVIIMSNNRIYADVETKQSSSENLDDIAIEYIKLGLQIGIKDKDFIDAYYGPVEYAPIKTDIEIFLKKDYLEKIRNLEDRIKISISKNTEVENTNRGNWLLDQLTAFRRRVEVFSGSTADFDKESEDLFGVTAPTYTQSYFDNLLSELEKIVPNDDNGGDLFHRIQALTDRFIIPEDKLDTVFNAAINEAKNRTKKYLDLPNNEEFTLEYVKGTSWSGYNWYKGNYHSVIQINTDLPIYIERAIDLACHEGYPGHHVYNLLLERNLYRTENKLEISMYPLFSPQSLIAEGSANYGIELAFPRKERIQYIKEVLLPLAGLDTTGFDLYFRIGEIKGQLSFARNEVGRGLLNKTMSQSEAIVWLKKYNFMTEDAANKSIRFIYNYRSYIINYNYGLQLVEEYVKHKIGEDNSQEAKWNVFKHLLSTQIRIKDLIAK